MAFRIVRLVEKWKIQQVCFISADSFLDWEWPEPEVMKNDPIWNYQCCGSSNVIGLKASSLILELMLIK